MKENNINKDISGADYEIIKQIEEHAKQYDQASDKKNFLKNVSAYEQKVILLNSERPYEVLMYLDELDLKSSRLVISELTYDEIKKILYLFTSEDKKNFYKFFSDLDIVNEFIKYDSNSSEHIQSLSFERKVDILESTKKETKEASSKIYESMSSFEQSKAMESVTDVDALNVLDEVVSDENVSENIEDTSNTENELENNEDKLNEQKVIEEDEISKNEELLNKEPFLDEKNQFIKNNLQKYIEKLPELTKIDINSDDIYNLLSDEAKSLIDSEFDMSNKTEKDKEKILEEEIKYDELNYVMYKDEENIENQSLEKSGTDSAADMNVENVLNTSIVKQFEQLKEKCEQEEIKKFQSKKINSMEEESLNKLR